MLELKQLFFAVGNDLFEIFKWIKLNVAYLLTFFSFILATYFYFKNLKRLVYSLNSKQIITEDHRKIKNLSFSYFNSPVESLSSTSIIIYNNGQKTINSEDMQELLAIKVENGKIYDYEELTPTELIKTVLENDAITIDLNGLDSRKPFALRVFHEGEIILTGRVKESGQILDNETKLWTIVNFVMILLVFFGYLWAVSFIDEDVSASWSKLAILSLTSILIIIITRFIHSQFFIPDKLVKKYLS
jgi:hypothetical protein